MGLFHKTIKNIIGKINSGHLKDAQDITIEHIEHEHHFGGDLVRLQRAICTYHEKLHDLRYLLSIEDKENSLSKAEDVEEQVKLISEITNRLIVEEKIDIE